MQSPVWGHRDPLLCAPTSGDNGIEAAAPCALRREQIDRFVHSLDASEPRREHHPQSLGRQSRSEEGVLSGAELPREAGCLASGSHPSERLVGAAEMLLPVSAPRVNDRRINADGELSRILPPYMLRSPKVAEVLPLLYLHGLSTGPPIVPFPCPHPSKIGGPWPRRRRIKPSWLDPFSAFRNSRAYTWTRSGENRPCGRKSDGFGRCFRCRYATA